MFDIEKIQRMTALLEKLPEEFDNVYILPEVFTHEALMLFKRLKISIRAMILDGEKAPKEIAGFPVIKTSEAVENFNERTILIIITNKPVPLIQTTFDFKKKGGMWTIPALTMANSEVKPIYDRLTISKILQQYKEDGISSQPTEDLPERFARGLTTFLDSSHQNFKYQIWDRRWFSKPTHAFDDTAIVIQGPIAYDNNYTVETFKLYRSIYPNVPIVVSTWKNEATKAFRKECEKNSVVLLENEPPSSSGFFNMNLQLVSSLQGVKYVKENTSAKFVLKTRNDQRINYSNFLVYFKNLLETFPPKGDKLHKRIIFLGSLANKDTPFHPHDFLSFGHIEDIFKLYDISIDDKVDKIKYFLSHRKIIDSVPFPPNFDYYSVTQQTQKLRKFNKVKSRAYFADTCLARSFYEKYIAPIDDTKIFETDWKFTADYLILIDFDMIHLDWPKYENMRYKTEFLYGVYNNAFERWLDMYRNFKIDWI